MRAPLLCVFLGVGVVAEAAPVELPAALAPCVKSIDVGALDGRGAETTLVEEAPGLWRLGVSFTLCSEASGS